MYKNKQLLCLIQKTFITSMGRHAILLFFSGRTKKRKEGVLKKHTYFFHQRKKRVKKYEP